MNRLPADRLEAERFYRTLKAVSIAFSNGIEDPWSVIPWAISERHVDIISKLEQGGREHRAEVEEYLLECLRLSRDVEPAVRDNVISFPRGDRLRNAS